MYQTSAKKLSKSQMVSIKDKNKQKIVMPFKVRRYAKINDELLDKASADGLTSIPAHSKIRGLEEVYCPYVER
jgi:hypothetical protein